MFRPCLRPVAILLAMVAMAVALSACGRRGALEPPPSAAVKAKDGSNAPAKERDRPFILDGLI